VTLPSREPPRLTQALLGLLLPIEEREFVLGDLEEGFRSRLDTGATFADARRGYRRDAMSAVRSLAEGNMERRARARAARRQGDGVMKNLLRDARYALRLLVRKPAFAVVAILTLALGIGANTAIFTVIHALLIKPLPYSAADRLVVVRENNLSRGWASFSVAPANFLDWRTQAQSFDAVAAYGGGAFNYVGGGEPERLRGLAGTAGFFEMLDGTPVAGRIFTSNEYEAGAPLVVVLGHGFWQRAFGGDRRVVDTTIVLNGRPHLIVGIMHPEWRFSGRDISVFTPRTFSADEAQGRGGHYLSVLARLKPGATLDQASTEMSALARRLEEAYPATNKGWGIVTTSLHEAAVGHVRPMLILLVAAVGVVLLVACANLANMQLARATVRAREISIRTALGAGRGRITRQLLTESLILSIAGGVLGVLLAYWATSAFIAAYPTLLPRSSDIHLAAPVLLFTAGLSVATAILFGLAPAISGARANLVDALKAAGRGAGQSSSKWIRSSLVVAEVAMAMVLLVGAGLLIKSFVRLASVDPGFETANRLSVLTLLPMPKYSEDARMVDFYDRAVEQVRAVPGVETVALTQVVPISGSDEIYSLGFEGRPPLPPGQGVSAIYYLVSPDYFATLGIPILKGRGFTAQDRAGTTRVAIVSETFVKMHYPNEDPIGKRISIGRNSNIIREIVGVVPVVKHYGLTDKDQAQMYEPFAQMPSPAMTFIVKSAVDPDTLVPAIRGAIQKADPEQPIATTTTLDRLLANSSAVSRVQTLLVGGFAAITLLLASIGLYGVMAYSVSQRTQEIGVRMALGARGTTVLLMVLRQALVLVAAGLAIGLVAAIVLGRLLATTLEPMLFQVTPADTATLAVVPIVLAGVGFLASWIPARRATRVDPIQALRP
jgi:putative ABC transport system permease protein